MSLSVIINTFNEERNIRNCLETVKWADDIIIVDMHSNDRTIEIASEYTDQIFFHEFANYVEPARNFAIAKSHRDWVLVVDADERISPELRNEILEAIQHPNDYSGFKIRCQDYMFGKWINHGFWRSQYVIRLFKQGTCYWPELVHSHPIIAGTVGTLINPILHYSHITISNFLAKLNRYTDLEAEEWYKQGIRKGLCANTLDAFLTFGKEYVYRQGFRDGGHGLVLAILFATYRFTARAKLWEMWYKHDHDTQ